MRAICTVASTGHKDTHTHTQIPVSVAMWLPHMSSHSACVWIIIVCVSVWLIIRERLCMQGRLCVFRCMCVPSTTVGCGGWNVCFSAGPVRPLLLNICPQHINSPTLTHPSLPRDHLIEIHNDSFFSSIPHWAKWSREISFRQKDICISYYLIINPLVCFFFILIKEL